MLKYRTKSGKIEAHQVLRETRLRVVLAAKSSANPLGREVHEGKLGKTQSWHDSWADAHAHLIKEGRREVERLEAQLEAARQRLEAVKKLTPAVSAEVKS